MKHSICRLALSTMFWLLVCSGVQAQVQRNAILAIEVAQPDSRIEVRIKLRMPPANIAGSFFNHLAARIVIDFSDTDNTVDARPPSAETGVLRGVTVATSAGRSRIVLNLKHMPPYAVRTEADTVIVAIAGNEALPVSSSTRSNSHSSH